MQKNQANAKQHLEAELLLLENDSGFSSTLYHPKVIGHILKNEQQNKYVCIHEIVRLITMKMKMKMKNRSHRYNVNIPKPRYSKYK